MKKIIFVANSSKRYRYYRLISDKMKKSTQVIFPVYPTLSLILGFFKKVPLDEDILLATHLRRQRINYPALAKYLWCWRFYCFLAYRTESARFFHYYNIFNKLNCEAVAIWNGQKQPYLTMVKAAEHAKKRILFFENGLLPNTTTVDYCGVNAHNCLPRTPEFYLNYTASANKLNNSDIVTNGLTKQHSLKNKTVQLLTRDPHKKRKLTNQKLNSFNFPYIFIPFQVPADSQVVLHSPWVQSMEQLFHLVRDARNHLMQQGHTEFPYLVFKEHPSWPGNFTELYNMDDYCLFANENSTQDLIENSEAVITINSTVGLESLLLGKKVITLGNACYNIEQLVLSASNKSELIQILSTLASWEFNEALRQSFIHFISEVYCIPSDWQKIIEKNKNNKRLSDKDANNEISEIHMTAIKNRIFETDCLAKHLIA